MWRGVLHSTLHNTWEGGHVEGCAAKLSSWLQSYIQSHENRQFTFAWLSGGPPSVDNGETQFGGNKGAGPRSGIVSIWVTLQLEIQRTVMSHHHTVSHGLVLKPRVQINQVKGNMIIRPSLYFSLPHTTDWFHTLLAEKMSRGGHCPLPAVELIPMQASQSLHAWPLDLSPPHPHM